MTVITSLCGVCGALSDCSSLLTYTPRACARMKEVQPMTFERCVYDAAVMFEGKTRRLALNGEEMLVPTSVMR